MTDFERSLKYWAEKSPANLRRVKDWQDEAAEKMFSGGGQVTIIISGSQNNKSHTQQVVKDATQVFDSCTNVLKALDGVSVDQSSCLEIDLSNITGR